MDALREGGGRARKGGITRGGYRLEHVVEQVNEHERWEAERMQQYILNEIITGDARALAPSIPDASVDLVFTDPVYDRIEDYRWLAETAARVLKPGGALLAFCGIGYLPETLDALRAGGLAYRWLLTANYAMRKQYHGRLQVSMTICLWMEKGRSKLYAPVGDNTTLPPVREARYVQTNGASWDKHPKIVNRYLFGFTPEHGIVWEPFAGLGAIPAAAKRHGRNFIASEIDPATAERARERLANTQPPLPGLVVEQAGFDLSAA
jgi:SAM-dependent methyltransferase